MTGTNKTILHFITGLESGGGAEHFLGRILPRLQEHEPVVCSMRPPGEMSRKLKDAGVRVYSLHMALKYNPSGVVRYRRLIQNIQPDAQINYLFHADVFGRVFGSLFGVPNVISFLRNKHQSSSVWLAETCTLPLVDCVFANSQAVMTYYKTRYHLPECTAVIPNGIPLPDRNLQPDNLSEDLVSDEDIVVTSVARLHPQKGLKTLIEAVALLVDDLPNLRVFLVGEGKQRDELEAFASRLEVEDVVQFLGNRDDVYSILSVSDVFVLPSKKEGMSNALLEAMACELPCVVSDIPENTELITDQVNGRTFQLQDAGDLAGNLLELTADPEACRAYGRAAREQVEANHTMEAVRSKFEQTIAEIV